MRNDIDTQKKLYHPMITSTQLKSCVSPGDLLDETALALIKMVGYDNGNGKSFRLLGKFGVDGSGSHKIRQQIVDAELALSETGHLDPKRANSFLISCYVPLELSCNNVKVWTNPVPNSTAYARPITLTRAQES